MAQNCKYYKEKKQVSYDNGVTYVDVSPAEYRKGDLIESSSTDCGYSPTPTGYSNQYLTFVAVDSGTFSFSGTSYSTINNSSILYSTDNGSTWNTLNRNVQSPTISAGNKIMWKSSALRPVAGGTSGGIGKFSSTGRFNIEGNIMSLLYGDNFANQTSLSNYAEAFDHLFELNKVVSAENLILPATTLSEACYQSMFQSCSGLTTPPQLPATALENYCYAGMFAYCPSLTTAPILTATTLKQGCYSGMFTGCGLTTAPDLPATEVKSECYLSMFSGCTSLNYVKCLATSLTGTVPTYNWLANVASSGTFVKNSSMSSWTSGASGIPSNWTVQNA